MKYYLLLICICSSFFVVGQSELFENNTSGISLQGFLSPDRIAPTININPGYVHNGRWSFNLIFARRFSENRNVNSFGVTPAVSYLLLKQGLNNKILNLKLTSYYQHVKFIDYENLVSQTIGLGATVNHKIEVNKSLKFFPEISIWRYATAFKVNNEFEDEIYSRTSFGISFTTLFKQYFVKPNYFLNETGGSFSLNFGIIFPN